MPDEIKVKVVIDADTSGADKAKEAIGGIEEAGNSAGESMGKVGDAATSLNDQLGKTAESTRGFTDAVSAFELPARAGEEAMSAFGEAAGEGQKAIEETTSAMEDLYKPLESTVGLMEDLSPPLAKATEHMQAMGEQLSPVSDGFTSIQDRIAQVTPLMATYADNLQSVGESVVASGGSFDKLSGNIEAMDTAMTSSDPFSVIQDHITATGQTFDEFSKSVGSGNQAVMDWLGSVAPATQKAMTAVDYGLGDFEQNMTVFQSALSDPAPFSMIQSHLNATGQTWEDFGSSIGDSNAQILQDMATQGTVTHEVLGGISESVQSTGKTFTESANAAQAYTDQFNGLNTAATGANKAIENTGMVAEDTNKSMGAMNAAIADTGKAMESGSFGAFASDVGSMLGDTFGGVMNGLSQVMMPMMAVQMIGMAVGAVATGIYNAAVIAEGPAAHGIGTFTGSIDALGNTMAVNTQQFSEGFGQGIIPVIDAMNYSMSQGTSSAQDYGKYIGGVATMFTNLALITAGVALPGSGMFTQGAEGFANQVSTLTGGPIIFNGAPGATPQQQIANIQAQLIPQTQQLQAQATDPTYLAAQAQLSYASGQAVIAQQSWQDSHYTGSTGPVDPFNHLMQAQMDTFNGQSYGTADYLNQFDPNRAYFNSLGTPGYDPAYGGVGGAASGGCFPAGTRVLLLDNTERPIETLRVDDRIAGHNGTRIVPTTVVACITYPLKQTYDLVFHDGRILTLTDSHPVATPEGWKALSPATAKEENPDLVTTVLTLGDHVYTSDGTTCTLISIQRREIVKVYNITVDGSHTYYANGMLVHNGKTLMSTGDTSGISENIPVSVTWSIQGELSKAWQAVSTWSVSGELAKAWQAVSAWSISGALEKAWQAVSSWNISGDLAKAWQAVSSWSLSGELAKAWQAVSSWSLSGDLAKAWQAVSSWNLSGDLNKAWNAVSTWTATGLEHLFNGAATWAATGLEHTFNAVANWTAQNLNPVFNVAASFIGIPGFATGVENFAGGAAVVGEKGPELVMLPGGSSVYPMTVGAGVGSSVAFGGGGNSGGGAGGPMTLQLYVDSTMLAQQIIPQIAPIMRAQFGVRR